MIMTKFLAKKIYFSTNYSDFISNFGRIFFDSDCDGVDDSIDAFPIDTSESID